MATAEWSKKTSDAPEKLADHGIRPSVGTVGDSYDNSLAETVNGLYKTELIYSQPRWWPVTEVDRYDELGPLLEHHQAAPAPGLPESR